MIDDKTKQKLLKELEKSGNVSLSCLKTGIDKATFYRWKKDDKKFKRLAENAIRYGRESNCDIAEHALMMRVKEKDPRSIEYYLKHNSDRYKKKHDSNIVITHKKETPVSVLAPKVTLEDLLKDDEVKLNEKVLNIIVKNNPEILAKVSAYEMLKQFDEEVEEYNKKQPEIITPETKISNTTDLVNQETDLSPENSEPELLPEIPKKVNTGRRPMPRNREDRY